MDDTIADDRALVKDCAGADQRIATDLAAGQDLPPGSGGTVADQTVVANCHTGWILTFLPQRAEGLTIARGLTPIAAPSAVVENGKRLREGGVTSATRIAAFGRRVIRGSHLCNLFGQHHRGGLRGVQLLESFRDRRA